MTDLIRARHELHRELAHARDDLAARLSLLEHRVREAIDVRARIRVALARVRLRAVDRIEALRLDIEANPRRYEAIGVTMFAMATLLVVRAIMRARRR